jgi:1-acyl-sn-glycerol-3-phosphate acyltransferase
MFGAYPVGPYPTRTRRVVYFANHTSHLDTLVLLAALSRRGRLRARPVAARDYWGRAGLRHWVAEKLLNVVFIDRTHAAETDPLAPLKGALREGYSLVLFPEGTRSDADLPQRFKSGLFHLSEAFPNAAFVPVYLENLNRIFPKNSRLPVPLINRVHFGGTLQLDASESKECFLRRAHDAVCALAPRRVRA